MNMNYVPCTVQDSGKTKISSCPQEAHSPVKEKDKSMITSGQCGANNNRQRIAGKWRKEQSVFGGVMVMVVIWQHPGKRPYAGWVLRKSSFPDIRLDKFLPGWGMVQRQGSVKIRECGACLGSYKKLKTVRHGRLQWEVSLRKKAERIWEGMVQHFKKRGLCALTLAFHLVYHTHSRGEGASGGTRPIDPQ